MEEKERRRSKGEVKSSLEGGQTSSSVMIEYMYPALVSSASASGRDDLYD